jgi:hypothetical protein
VKAIDYNKIEQQFHDKLREIYKTHKSLQDRFNEEEFVKMFSIKYSNGRPRQPVEPENISLDPGTFQLVLAAFNDVYP